MISLRVVLVLIALSAAGCTSADEPAPADAPPIGVSVAQVERAQAAAQFEAGGVVRSRSTAVIASRVMAPVTAVHVRPGDRVKRGAPLVTLDARETKARRARETAAFAAAMESAAAAETDVRTAESRLALARATHDRIRTLHDKRSATPQELDEAVAGLNAADAQVGSFRARASAARAARDSAQASMEAAEIGLTYYVLSAPFDGLVTERTVDPGSMAAPGAPLLTIEAPGTLRLEVQLDEARAARLRPGAPVEVRLDSTAEGGWTAARIDEIARVDPASHTFLVKVDLPAASDLRSGRFGRVRFPGNTRETLAVPASSLLRRGQLTFVYRVDDDLRARLTPISPGAELTGGRQEVLAGLRDGERIVSSPPPSLSDGRRVLAGGRGAGTPDPGDRR
jgi:RND family efflux transporter MFP subunit